MVPISSFFTAGRVLRYPKAASRSAVTAVGSSSAVSFRPLSVLAGVTPKREESRSGTMAT